MYCQKKYQSYKLYKMQKIIKTIVLLVLIVIQGGELQAQLPSVWSRAIGGDTIGQFGKGQTKGLDIIESRTGGYIAAGIQDLITGAPREYPFLCKVDSVGNTIWKKNYFASGGLPNGIRDISLAETSSGDLLVVGTSSYTGSTGALLMKTNAQGDALWTTNSFLVSSLSNLPSVVDLQKSKIDTTLDGNYMVMLSGNANLGAPGPDNFTILAKIDENGTVLWEKIYRNYFANQVIPTIEGGYVSVGRNADGRSLVFYQLDAVGDSVEQSVHLDSNFYSIGGNSIVQLPDSSFMISTIFLHPSGAIQNGLLPMDKFGNKGSLAVFPGLYSSYIHTIRYDASQNRIVGLSGSYLIDYDLATGNYRSAQLPINSTGNEIELTSDGGYAIVGRYSKKLLIIKTNTTFQIQEVARHVFSGNIHSDFDFDCTLDTSSDMAMQGWIVEAQVKGDRYYGTSNTNGDYLIHASDTGDFVVKVITSNNLWQVCPDSITITSSDLTNSDTFNFATQPLVSCPIMTVDISTSFLRRCSTNTYTVSYCNNGTVDAVGSYVTVELDTFLTVLNTSIPYTVSGNMYTFQLGTVAWGDCGHFTIQTEVSCNAILGQVHCVDAHIYPDTICTMHNSAWDLSDVEVQSRLLGSNIEFTVKNIGTGNMSTTRQYYVTEDHVMLFTRPYQLGSGDSIVETIPLNGRTYRLAAEQDPNHPYNTFSASALTRPTFLTANSPVGSVLQYPESDGSPAVSIDCQANIGSFDPNDKRGFPMGYGSSHAIEANVDLEYHIRFQNTGTDTAFKVVVVDTLSGFLDKTTLQMGASSHSYTWELVDTGVLKVTFDNILLVDSITNEPLSHGFFKFRIKQKKDNPLGTVIENKAGIFFDWNAPIWTNTTFHTIDADFVINYIHQIDDNENLQLAIAPNPMQQQAIIQVEGTTYNQLEVVLVDAMGREVQRQQVVGEDKITLYRQNLSTGIYFFRLIGDDKLIGTGKVMVK